MGDIEVALVDGEVDDRQPSGVTGMGKGFRLILAVVAISICAGGVIGGGQPASAGEMTPETEKLFRAVRSNDFPMPVTPLG